MKIAVVDENVPIVANDATRISSNQEPLASQADDACRFATITRLQKLMAKGVIAIDDGGIVLAKYRVYLSGKGQPGMGDAFLRHVSDNSWNSKKVIQLTLKRRKGGQFAMFPNVASLRTFHEDDRIFVALARTAPKKATIINAVDSDYRNHHDELTCQGVIVEELCPHCLKERPLPRRSKRSR